MRVRSKFAVATACVALLASWTATRPSPAATDGAPSATRPVASHASARPGLRFIENSGQMDAGVAFAAVGRTRTVLLGPSSMTFAQQGGARPCAVDYAFAGAKAVVPRGERVTPTMHHYFRGRDGANAPLHARTFSSVAYDEPWPGVDVRFDAVARGMEYSLVVHPGADAAAARFEVRGALGVERGAAGELVVTSQAGRVVHSRPVAWQTGEDGRTAVDVAFDVRRDADDDVTTFGFVLGAHDASRTVVIDPIVDVETFPTGLSNFDTLHDVAADAQGNAYVCGRAGTPGAIPASVPSVQRTLASVYDAFVAKIDRTGNVVWASFLGGTATVEYEEDEYATGITVDSQNRAIVAGTTYSDDFPMLRGPSTVAGPTLTTFVSKFSADGSALEFSGFIEGTEFGNGAGVQHIGVATDAVGAAYLAGFTYGTIPVTTVLASSTGTNPYAWVSKVNPDGGRAYALSLKASAGSFGQRGTGIAVDSAGAAYVCGWTSGASSLPSAAAASLAFHGGQDDAFVVKVNPSGTALEYTAFLGGTGSDEAAGIAVDSTGAAYVAGTTSSDTASFPRDQLLTGGGAFYAKLSPAGTAVEFVGATDAGGTIALDPARRMYLGGGSVVQRVAADGAAIEQMQGSGPSWRIAVASASSWWSLGQQTVSFVSDVSAAPPLSVTATATSAREVTLTWEPTGGGAIGFVIERAEAGGPFETVTTVMGAGTSFVDHGVDPDTTYRYRVSTITALAQSAPTASADVRTGATIKVRLKSGRFIDKAPAGRDVVALRTSFRFLPQAARQSFDPAAESVRVAVGTSFALDVPKGDPGWTIGRSASVWRGEGGGATGVTLTLDFAHHRMSLVARGLDLTTIPAGTVEVSVRVGGDAGSDAVRWNNRRSSSARVR